jgi:outer membrane protein assembly factor BamE (lipoprotein component of BamABCDE complex)
MSLGRDRIKRGVARALVVAGLATGLAACQGGETYQKGFVFEDAMLAELKPGTDVQSVLKTLGTPSTVSTVGNKTFYYISQQQSRRFQFMEAKVTDQRVLAVYFNSNFKVERVANYGLQDGKVFDFISRTTPTSGNEQSFLRQIFRGVGTFNPFGA